MKTALSWLLDQLKNEGRLDLIAGYKCNNRKYNIQRQVKEARERLEKQKLILLMCDTDIHRRRVLNDIELLEKYIASRGETHE